MADPLATPARCLLCHRTGDDYLCIGCTKDTRVRLECWPDLYAGLAAVLAPSGGGAQVRGSRPVYAPLPLSEEVLDLRGPGGLVGAAEGWVSAIRHERGRERPDQFDPSYAIALWGSLAVPDRLRAAVAELLEHLPWVAVSWPSAGAFAVDIRDVTRAVAAIVSPPDPVDRGIRMGNCPGQFDDESLCGAELRLPPGGQVVTCPRCATTYPPATWAGLKVLMDADARAVGNTTQPARITPSL